MVVLFPISFHVFVSHCTDALMASVFATIYIVIYSTQSPNIALLSCLLQTLGIVYLSHTQYTQLLTLDSSCLISCHSCMQPSQSVLLCSTDLLYNKFRYIDINIIFFTEAETPNLGLVVTYLTDSVTVFVSGSFVVLFAF